MASQTLVFVLLPNGPRPGNKLGLSLYLTPRLSKAATLADFPDFLHWPESIKSKGLQFHIACGTQQATVSADPAVLRPDIWDAIFTPSTFVEEPKFPDFDQRLIVSYPARDALAYLKYAYQSVATNRATNEERILSVVLGDLSFREGTESLLDQALSQQRVNMWREQQNSSPGIATSVPRTAAPSLVALPPDGVPTTLQANPPPGTRDMITRFALYHHMPPAFHRPPLPKSPAGFAKTLDFHRALTVLNSYPSLLRALGLVFDVEVPVSLCPLSPAAGAYGTIALEKIVPGIKFKISPQLSFARTAYLRDQTAFCAAPATAPADLAGNNFNSGDVVKGLVALTPESFHLVQLDLDGALLKAMTLADNVANSIQNTGDVDTIEEVLPSLRSAGLALMANGRGLQLLQSIRDNKSFDQALANNTAPGPFNALQLVRGYRIDIWSSRTRRWYSLHSRKATYQFGPDGTLIVKTDEEGFTQLSAAQPADDPKRKPDPVATQNNIPQPGTDIYLHERVARWDGWSLSVARPGKSLNRSADPGVALDQEPSANDPVTPFKMKALFAPAAHSLPELRFGLNYRLRARAVDLAGNSVALDTPTPIPFSAPANGTQLTYLRFEPISPPLVVLQQPVDAGRSLERLVIRSRNSKPSLDSQATTDLDQRHIAPPRVGERMVEEHGMLDDAQGRLKGDLQTYELIRLRDKFELPKQDGVPLEPGPNVKVKYLPDPIAAGAALRNLPNTPDDTNGRISGDQLKYSILPDVQPRPGSVSFIDFGTRPWPNLASFRLALVEGAEAPRWNSTERILTVSLPKAGVATVPLSCFLRPPDLDLMGVWGWLREFFEASEQARMQDPNAGADLTTTSDFVSLITRLVLEGGHEMITPTRSLLLVHAVQQPIGRPAFIQLPVVHQPSAPILASALRNSFTPITAWRSVGSHDAALLGGLQVHGASSAKIDLESRFVEVTDDPSLPAPTETVGTHHVETIDLSALGGGPIFSDQTLTRMVAVYVPRVDVLWFSAPFDKLDGVPTPADIAAPVHHFDDTKHRWVEYTATATSRFQEYFTEKGLEFTRSGPALVVDVPSSARPAAPDLAYAVPTFGWERQETSNVKSSVRFGNGLRVYLNRGWYSSGEDELLGVVLWPGSSPAPDYPTREKFKEFFTQWGNDPIWQSGAMEAVPTTADFPNAVAKASGLKLEETDQTFDVAGHPVVFEPQRKLWYCDIQFQTAFTYGPFVRLALARYQPHSINGVELSHAVLADFAQLAPNRSAVLSIDPADPRRARLFIGGLGPEAPGPSVVEVNVERRALNIDSDLDWKPASGSDVHVTEDAPAPIEPGAVLWSGSIVFAKTPPRGQFRVVVREFETLPVDAGTLDTPPSSGQRLVYAAILKYDYP